MNLLCFFCIPFSMPLCVSDYMWTTAYLKAVMEVYGKTIGYRLAGPEAELLKSDVYLQ